jgi:Family of unknown function (DUF6614)
MQEQLMDIYHIWCNLKPGTGDLEFTRAAQSYLQNLVDERRMASFRIMRRKLGLGIAGLGEFHLMLEFSGLAQLDEAFSKVASRADPIESFHYAVNSKVCDLSFALYRDFPDSNRVRGEEKFQ